MENIWIAIISLIGVIISAQGIFIIAIIKIRNQNNDIAKKISGFSGSIVDVVGTIQQIMFERTILNTIKSETSLIVNYSKSLKRSYRDSMIYFSKLIESIFLDYYSSTIRGDEVQMTRQMESEFSAIQNVFKQYLIQNFKLKKKFTNEFGKEEILNFSMFIENSNLDNQIEILMGKLIEDGYTQETFIQGIRIFINRYFERYIKLISNWDDLQIITENENKD